MKVNSGRNSCYEYLIRRRISTDIKLERERIALVFETATLENSGVNNEIETRSKTLKRKRYINAVNYANFNGDALKVIFIHRIFKRQLTVSAHPSPCINDSLELEWEPGSFEEDLDQFECIKILIPDGEHILSLVPADYCLTPSGITVSLPLSAEILNNRRSERFPGVDIKVILTQNGGFYEGRLENFNLETFLVTLSEKENPELRWINREDVFHIILKKKSEILFTGNCFITSTREHNGEMQHTFKLMNSEIRKFKKKKYRGERYDLLYPVQVIFDHPLSRERCRIGVTDISASGMGLSEKEAHSVLIPGLVIPEMELNLPGGSPLKCRTQVIHRQTDDEELNGELRYGIALIDMAPADHSILLNFVHQENDSRTSVCPSVSTTALWKFFFESGFIYPEKYKHLSSDKEKMKDIYDRLYRKSPGIARHFIYQEGPRIQGHMSMLRSYEESWLLHHHAATSIENHNAGLHVLNQVGSFSNNSHRIRSMHMLYLMCYYREENRFPRRVFGDIAKNADNKAQISLDSWAYFHCYRDTEIKPPYPQGWTLEETSVGDLRNLECFYQNHSGGLMLKAMNLTGGDPSNVSLMKEYSKSGFNRSIKLFSIKHYGICHGIIMADQSETGLNLSNLTNSIKLFIINPEGLSRDIIDNFILEVAELFEGETRIPVLMYPESSAEDLNIPKEKNYTLWILNTDAGDAYFKYLKTLLKKINH